MRLAGLFLLALVVFLLIPFLGRDAPRPGVVGPSLERLEYDEVTFQNGDLHLAGILFMPEGKGPFPAVVVIHGSGTSRRDNPWYLTIVAELQSNGFAVLLPDKRGSEKSGGDWRDTSFEELATDTEAALAYVANLPRIDASRIGLVGQSQGGWIAPIVASRAPDLAFVVSISGAGVTAEEQLEFEEVNNILQIGTYRFFARWIAALTVPRIKQKETWRATAGYDPMSYWSEVQPPVFAAFGGGDTNVPVEESVRRFQALPQDILIKVYPHGGHGITDPETGLYQRQFLDDFMAFASTHTLPAR